MHEFEFLFFFPSKILAPEAAHNFNWKSVVFYDFHIARASVCGDSNFTDNWNLMSNYRRSTLYASQYKRLSQC